MLATKLLTSLQGASQHNSNVMVAPEVILWPDPDRQWASIVSDLQATLPSLLLLGDFDPALRRGPVTWLKCMVARVLPEADWDTRMTPIIYLPGYAKSDLLRLGDAALELQPLLEYLHTGVVWAHRNGKEWTVPAFLQNDEEGLGLNLSQDQATKVAVLKVLPTLFADESIVFPNTQLDASYFQSLVFPELVPSVLRWLEEGDVFLGQLPPDRRGVFEEICLARFGIQPKPQLLVEAARLLGSQKNAWKAVWDYFANAPQKYPVTVNLLRQAKPPVLGNGLFALPEESWPQVNEAEEEDLRSALTRISHSTPIQALTELENLESVHCRRRYWVWFALNHSPLAAVLPNLLLMAKGSQCTYAWNSLEDLRTYYIAEGHLVDRAMRDALELIRLEKDRKAVLGVIDLFYRPWLTVLAERFQATAIENVFVFSSIPVYEATDELIVFVDALRYELAVEYLEKLIHLQDNKYTIEIKSRWSAIPSLTNTAKAAIAPIAGEVDAASHFDGFYPQNASGKNVNADTLRKMISDSGRKVVGRHDSLEVGSKYWIEMGDIDEAGHNEGAKLVHRLDALFVAIRETLENAFDSGLQQVRIVTDHGWLLMPGGLPKAELPMPPVHERLGRCAVMKEGAKTDLPQLPWRWNPAVHIAYAKGIDFHKKNVEYAHGGLSLQECLVPDVLLRMNHSKQKSLAKIVAFKWVGLRCTVQLDGSTAGLRVDIRRKFSEQDTSLVLGKNGEIENLQAKLLVDDAAEGDAAHLVLLDNHGTILDRKLIVIGENREL